MSETIIQDIKYFSHPFNEINDLHVLYKEITNQKYVLLGESSHGTAEFYEIRAEISKKLITEKGFTFIAVEGDWPACQYVNRYIKGYDHKHSSARDVLKSFNRWPTWMWANEEMISFIEWLKDYNATLPTNQRIGFYGIDIYSLWESIDEVLIYLESNNDPKLDIAKKAFACFEPFNKRPEKYGVSAAFYSEGCRDEVLKLLSEIQLSKSQYIDYIEESSLNLEVNALITANAENYYRTMIVNDNESWNIRDRHMVEVLMTINRFYQNNAKGIVWEHNTHIGDARATDMMDEGLVNVGQLLREQLGKEKVYAIGFGTHRGTVIAADQWGANLEKMIVPPAENGSWEDLMHRAGPTNKLLLFNEENKHRFNHVVGHRAIGVVYHPAYEHHGNYVPSIMSERYDAFIYVNYSSALSPLKIKEVFL